MQQMLRFHILKIFVMDNSVIHMNNMSMIVLLIVYISNHHRPIPNNQLSLIIFNASL